MATISKPTTAKQLLEMTDAGRCELIEGELIMMSPAGFEHGRVENNIAWFLTTHVRANDLGIVTGAETGFHISHEPDTVRAPDAGFLRTARIPAEPVRGFFEGPPDLAVEVLSPDDRARAVARKVAAWLQAGCLQVWIVDPVRRTIRVHAPDASRIDLDESAVLSGGDLLPGFSLPVRDVFARR